MNRLASTSASGILCLISAGLLGASDIRTPDWAYGYLKPLGEKDRLAPPCPPGVRPFPDCAFPSGPKFEDGTKFQLPGAIFKYTRTEVANDYGPADWYPGDHPAMPEIVANGRKTLGIRACALCHFPNGQGKPENGGVAGLPASYILQQLRQFKMGARRSADPRKANTNEMAQIARQLTDEEANAAADYFSSMKWRPWVKVMEVQEAPDVRSTVNGLFLPVPGLPVPLGNKIIEVPENPERTDDLRDPHSGFIAYVPVGSVAKGEALAKGGAKSKECAACHGAGLKGTSSIPGIAGRTASYLMRQLWDFNQGTRQSAVMAPIARKFSQDEMMYLAAYVTSLAP